MAMIHNILIWVCLKMRYTPSWSIMPILGVLWSHDTGMSCTPAVFYPRVQVSHMWWVLDIVAQWWRQPLAVTWNPWDSRLTPSQTKSNFKLFRKPSIFGLCLFLTIHQNLLSFLPNGTHLGERFVHVILGFFGGTFDSQRFEKKDPLCGFVPLRSMIRLRD